MKSIMQLFIIFVFVFTNIEAGELDTLWTKNIDNGYSEAFGKVILLTNRNYLCLGESFTLANDYDILFTVIKPSGEIVKKISWGKINYFEMASDIIETEDKGYIIVGIIDEYDGTYNKGWVGKLDSNFRPIWDNRYNSWHELYDNSSVIKTLDNNYLVVGRTLLIDKRVSLIKFDEDGNTLWIKHHYIDEKRIKDIYSAKQHPDSTFIICGGISTENYSHDAFLTKVTKNGELIWTKTFGGEYWDDFYDIIVTRDSNYLVVGGLGVASERRNSWLMKLNRDGEIIYEKTYDFGVSSMSFSVVENTEGNFFTAGQINFDNGTYFSPKYMYISEGGDLLDYQAFNTFPTSYFLSLSLLTDTTFVAVGEIYSYDTFWDGFVVKAGINVNPNPITIEPNIVTNFKLYQNYPNPFNPSTTIKFSIPTSSVIASGPAFGEVKAWQSQQSLTNNGIASSQVPRNDNVRLTIYNSLGQQVAELLNKPLTSGNYQVEFNTENLPSGIYFYRLQSGAFAETKKMILLK